MRTNPTAALRFALLRWCLGDNEPLAGDLIEESAHRSRTWFWHQLIFAVLARTATNAAATLRDPTRLVVPLASLAVFLILCFQVVVVGSLLASVLPPTGVAGPAWRAPIVLLSFPIAWGTGKTASHLRARSRLATVAFFAAAAALTALMTRSALSSATTVFFPAIGLQSLSAILFVIGVFAGAENATSDLAEPLKDTTRSVT